MRAREQELALERLACGGTVAEAAEAAGVTRATLWNWRRDDPDFAVRWAAALERRADALEDLGHGFLQRALAPDANPALAAAGVRLLLRMLAADRPARWSERQQTEVRHLGDVLAPDSERSMDLRQRLGEDAWHEAAEAMARIASREASEA